MDHRLEIIRLRIVYSGSSYNCILCKIQHINSKIAVEVLNRFIIRNANLGADDNETGLPGIARQKKLF